jgi:predicted nucleotidyltransferase
MRHTEALHRLLEKARIDPEILAVIVFGSAARREETDKSDLDLCLVLTPSRYDPAALAGKRLEYLQTADLDISILQALPLYIRRRVLREGRVEYVRDEDALYEVAYRSAQAYEDFKHLYQDYLDQVARG